MVEMKLSKIIINETASEQVIILQEAEGERSFPIMIGPFEALAIRRGVREEVYPRPLTHELLGSLIRGLSDGIDYIEVTELKDGTFFARIVVRRGDEVLEFDSRPSDAIALATAAKRPIFCADAVLDKVCDGH